MKCYFLNVRRFQSKSGKDCCMLCVADFDGQVSEFFISFDLFEQISASYHPFDSVILNISMSRGRVSVVSMEHEPLES